MKNDEIEEWLKSHDIIDKDARRTRRKKSVKADKRYNLIVNLHGLHLKEAKQKVKRDLKRAYDLKYSKILLIHGLGLHSSGEPILKIHIRNLVKTSAYVRDFTIAPIKDGGDGAIVVYIRKK